MGQPQRWNKSYSQLSSEYGVNVSSFKWWAKQGHDLNNDDVVRSLVSKARNRSPSSSAPRKPRKLTLDGALGLSGSLERLRQAELELSTAYVDSLGHGSPDAFTLRKEWLDVCEQLRKAEKDSPDVLEANKKTVTIDEVQKVLTSLLNDLRTNLEGLPARVTKELPHDVGVLVISSIRNEVNDYVEDLFKCRFLKGSDAQ